MFKSGQRAALVQHRSTNCFGTVTSDPGATSSISELKKSIVGWHRIERASFHFEHAEEGTRPDLALQTEIQVYRNRDQISERNLKTSKKS